MSLGGESLPKVLIYNLLLPTLPSLSEFDALIITISALPKESVNLEFVKNKLLNLETMNQVCNHSGLSAALVRKSKPGTHQSSKLSSHGLTADLHHCFVSGDMDHLANNCPNEDQKCYGCGTVGRTKDKCPKQSLSFVEKKTQNKENSFKRK